MDLLHGLFSYKGRLNRLDYFGCSVLINFVGLPVNAAEKFYEGSNTPIPPWLALGGMVWVLALQWPASAIIVKRGHDRARPAWFSVAVLIAGLTAFVAVGVAPGPITGALVAVAVIYQLIDYLFMPASPKAGRYNWPPAAHPEIAQVFS